MEKKYIRTSSGQLKCYIRFVKVHPEMMAGKNNPTDPKCLENLWAELSDQLNSFVGPTKSPAAWKETLRNWRKQLQSRARKVRAEQSKAGGGRNRASELSNFEQQALQVLERHNEPALDIVKMECNANDSTENNGDSPASYSPPSPQNQSPIHSESTLESPQPTQSPFSPFDSPQSSPPLGSADNSLKPSKKCRKNFRQEVLDLVQTGIQHRREEQIALSQSLNNIGQGLSSLGRAVEEMARMQRCLLEQQQLQHQQLQQQVQRQQTQIQEIMKKISK